jgi:hypothetical protein
MVLSYCLSLDLFNLNLGLFGSMFRASRERCFSRNVKKSTQTSGHLGLNLVFLKLSRGVAQLGSALGSGPRGREFKSPLPDHLFLRSSQFLFIPFSQSKTTLPCPLILRDRVIKRFREPRINCLGGANKKCSIT